MGRSSACSRGGTCGSTNRDSSRRDSGSGSSSRWRTSWGEVAETEPVERICLVFGDGMTDALSKDTLDVRAEGRARVSRLRIIGGVCNWCLAHAEYVRPLLDLLPEILGIECGISISHVLAHMSNACAI